MDLPQPTKRQKCSREWYGPGVHDLFRIGQINIVRHHHERCDRVIAGPVSDEVAFWAKGRVLLTSSPIGLFANQGVVLGALLRR